MILGGVEREGRMQVVGTGSRERGGIMGRREGSEVSRVCDFLKEGEGEC